MAFPREKGEGRQSRSPCGTLSFCPSLSAARELKMRRKVHLPTNDVVETPCKLHGCSCPSLEAGANQSKHVLGENRVQNQAGVRTTELTEAQAGAQAGQTTVREILALATEQGAALPRTGDHMAQEPTWKRLLPKGSSLRHH